MQENFETFEQYCIEKQHNVILEEHFLPNGERQIFCRSKEKCEQTDCSCIQRLHERIKIMNSFQK